MGLGKPRGHLGPGCWCQRHLPVPAPGTSPARAVPAGLSPQHLLFLAGHQQLHDQQHSCQPAPGHPPACGPRQPVRVPHWQRRLQDQGDPRGAWCPAQGGSTRGVQVSPRANPCIVPASGMWRHWDFLELLGYLVLGKLRLRADPSLPGAAHHNWMPGFLLLPLPVAPGCPLHSLFPDLGEGNVLQASTALGHAI